MNRFAGALICVYQSTIRYFFIGTCRYYPSCSEYAKLCFEKYSFASASYKTCSRICRCHPYAPGGVDFP